VLPCTMWAMERSPCSEREQVLQEQRGKLTLLERQPIAPLTRKIKLVTNLIRTVVVFLIAPHVLHRRRSLIFLSNTKVVDGRVWRAIWLSATFDSVSSGAGFRWFKIGVNASKPS
jgi:hypothetical protein